MGLPILGRSTQTTHIWVKQAAEELRWRNERRAFLALPTVLRRLRKRLTAEETVQLGAQLPTFVRGRYYEGRLFGLCFGFTLLELIISIAILALLVSGTVVVASVAMDTARQSETLEKLMTLKRAMLGDPRIVTKESRTDFGYIGDMGSLPATLDDLWIRGSRPAYAYHTAEKAGAGWAGPYIPVGPLDFTNDLLLDAWGNPIQYVLQTGTSALTGSEYRALLFSYGRDGTASTADDITLELYTNEMFSTVASYVRDGSGNPVSSVSVKVNYPFNGVLTCDQTFTDSNVAYFSVSNVPIGNRSVVIEPKLAYQAGSAISTGGLSNDVYFNVLSFTCGTVNTMKATYDKVAYFASAKIGNTIIYDSSSPPAASGQLLTFSPVDISGTGCSGGSTGGSIVSPVRVQSPFVLLPDQDLSAAAAQATAIQVQLNTFKDNPVSGGTAVDMTGASFTVEFSDGSKAIFTVVRQR